MLAVLVLACAAACASGPKRPPVGTLEPDKFLWERGTDELNEKHWLTAREYFRQLMDSYPQSTYRADAKLGLADTFLGEGSLEANVLAINEYREFLSFYPTHPRADYAQYKLGMSHFYQMHGPDRDQTETREAIVELALMIRRYPSSLLVPEARKNLRTARDRLGDAEYGVAYFYVRTQKFPPAAIERFKAILKEDPEYTPPRCGLLLSRAVVAENAEASRGAAPAGAPRRRIRAERVPRRRQETGGDPEGGPVQESQEREHVA